MKTKYIKITSVFFCMLLCLVACSNKIENSHMEPQNYYDWMSESSPIPTQRTGLDRQGIYALQNGFEVTSTGVYFMCDIVSDGGRYLLYGDHGSDTLIKLCGRPDCDHSGSECNAFFRNGTNICYYDGHLYAIEKGEIGENVTKVVRMNLDGTERSVVIDTGELQEAYSATVAPNIWNGIVTIGMISLNDAGQQVVTWYYYRLDESMENFEVANTSFPYYNDGETFIIVTGSSVYNAYRWDIQANQSTFLTQMQGEGYYGSKEAYYVREGQIYQLVYATGEEKLLLETGLEGEWNLHAFPDCFVLSKVHPSQDVAEDCVFYFYNWDFDCVGSVVVDFPWQKNVSSLICGESAERIILTDNVYKIPRYYIEKSELGTGKIVIHEYQMPDIDWEELLD